MKQLRRSENSAESLITAVLGDERATVKELLKANPQLATEPVREMLLNG